jgi:hypothetical protein
MEKRREFHLETQLAFIDHKKAFDVVNRIQLIKILKKARFPVNSYNIYKNTSIVVTSSNTFLQYTRVDGVVKLGCGQSPMLYIYDGYYL